MTWRSTALVVFNCLLFLGAHASADGRTGSAARTPSNAPAPFGFDAPLLQVDRFSDAAATRLRRSEVAGLPAPNAPIHLDRPPFLVEAVGPGGRKAHCYDLDIRPAHAARLYVFYDAAGNYILTQFPVIGVAPGDPGYSDLWDIWKVTAPASYRADNSIRDIETVERLLRDPGSGYTAERTGALVNGPIVPEGSTADMKADRREGPAALRYAWYKGRRAPYLYFEQTLRISGDEAPVSVMKVDATTGPGTVPLGSAGPVRLAALPGDPGYSPLHRVTAPDGRALYADPLNCPVVGP